MPVCASDMHEFDLERERESDGCVCLVGKGGGWCLREREDSMAKYAVQCSGFSRP